MRFDPTGERLGRGADPLTGQGTVVFDHRLNQGKPGEWEKHGEFSYPIALSLTSHLAERRGLDVLIDVLDYLGEGKGMDEALLRVFNEDYAAVCRRWDRSLREANR